MSEHDERLREAFSRRPAPAAAQGTCPDDETIWRAARGELEPQDVRGIVDHVARCGACANSWSMARAIADEAGVAVAPSASQRRWPPAFLALAAALFVVALFLPTLLEHPEAPGDEFRDPAAAALQSLLDESVALPRDAVVLRWTAGPPGTVYAVEIAGEGLRVIHRATRLDGTEYRVPAESLADLPAGATLYWRVEGTLPDATKLPPSRTFVLKIR